MRHRVTSVVVFIMAGTLFPATAPGAVFLDQQPTGVSGVFSDEGFDVFLIQYGYSQSVAENFQVTTGGSGALIDEVVVWGGFDPYGASSFPLWDDVDVLIHADDGGLPGSVLCSESHVLASRTATGAQVGGFDEYMVTLTLAEPCGLSDGQYWIEVFYNTTLGYDDWFWEFGALDATHGLPHFAWARENPGEGWFLANIGGFTDVAVKITGTVGGVACVATSGELQSALAAAGSNGSDDVIQVVQGSYLTPGTYFGYTTSESFDLQLLGGFTPGCANRTVAPANTVLDGHGQTPVLRLQATGPSNGDLVVQGLSIVNGNGTGEETAGLVVGGSFTGRSVITHNAVLGNHAQSGIAGVHASTEGAIVELVNNLIAGNTSAAGRGAGLLHCNGETTWVTNNTVADNTCTTCLGGLELTGSVSPLVCNNILWNNSMSDLDFTGLAAYLRTNDIGAYVGTPDPGSSGNFSSDPEFSGGGSYRPQYGSPVIDQGSIDVGGELPAVDLDGRHRVEDGQVDLGGYEYHTLIFASGFESGTLGGWSAFSGQ